MLLALGAVALERGPVLALRHARDVLALCAAACWALVCWRYELTPLLAPASACLLAAVVLPLRAVTGAPELDAPYAASP